MALGLSPSDVIPLVDTTSTMYQTLSFDGGGVRGYSSLFPIDRMSQDIAEVKKFLKATYSDLKESMDLESRMVEDKKKTMSTTAADFGFERSSRLCDGFRSPSYDKLGLQGRGPELPIWKAAQACSAAPFYLSPMCLDRGEDGNSIENNPCLVPEEMDRLQSPEDLSADLKSGGVKAKIGHTEAAAGISSFIKALHRIEERSRKARFLRQEFDEHLDFQVGSEKREVYFMPIIGVAGAGKAAIARQFIHDRRAVDQQSSRFRLTLEVLAHTPAPGEKLKLSSDWATGLTENFRQTLAVKRFSEQTSSFRFEKEACRKLDGDRDFTPERHTYPFKDHDRLPPKLPAELNKLVEQDRYWASSTCFTVLPRTENAMPLAIPLESALSVRPWKVMLSIVDAVRSLRESKGPTAGVLAEDWSRLRHFDIKPVNILVTDLKRHRVHRSHRASPDEFSIVGLSCQPTTTEQRLDDFWDLLRTSVDVPGDYTAGSSSHASELHLYHLLKRSADMGSINSQRWLTLMTTLTAVESAAYSLKPHEDRPLLCKARAMNPTRNQRHEGCTAALRSRKERRHQRSPARHRRRRRRMACSKCNQPN